MKKCHVAVRTTMWKVWMMWQDDVVGDMEGDCGGWHGPMVGCHMAQSWVATWQWENAQ
jgi:hypothetical protein